MTAMDEQTKDFEKGLEEIEKGLWGGFRPGAGRKKQDQIKLTKSFSLTRQAVENLLNLEVQLNLDSQSAVIEHLLLSAHIR